jgi:hypothetical protein
MPHINGKSAWDTLHRAQQHVEPSTGTERMTVVEQRKHQRYPLVRQTTGEFRLLTPAAAYPIDVIKDISSSGIRVYLNTYLAERLQIVVEYIVPTLKLELNGMVAWCAAQEEDTDAIETYGRYVVGIQLFSPVLLMAMSGLYEFTTEFLGMQALDPQVELAARRVS